MILPDKRMDILNFQYMFHRISSAARRFSTASASSAFVRYGSQAFGRLTHTKDTVAHGASWNRTEPSVLALCCCTLIGGSYSLDASAAWALCAALLPSKAAADSSPGATQV